MTSLNVSNAIHSSRHAAGGPDEITPAVIGADVAGAAAAAQAAAAVDAADQITAERVTERANQNSTYARVPPALQHVFTDDANGVPVTADTGQAFRVHNNGLSASGMTVASGALTHGIPTGSNAAGYLEINMGAKVTRMGMRATFPATSPGSAVLVAFALSIVDERAAARVIPSAGMHIKLDTLKAEAIVYRDTGAGGSTTLGTWTFATPLTADVEHTIEVVRDGTDLYLILPDGTTTPRWSHADVETLTGQWATAELYEGGLGTNPATITQFWADSTSIVRSSSVVSRLDVAKALAKKAEAPALTYDSATAATITLTAAYQTIVTVPVVTPASLRALVIVTAWCNITTAGGLQFWRTSILNNLTYGFEEAVGAGLQDGMRTVHGLVTFPTRPGEVTNLIFNAKVIGGAGSVVNYGGGGKPVTVTVIPLP